VYPPYLSGSVGGRATGVSGVYLLGSGRATGRRGGSGGVSMFALKGSSMGRRSGVSGVYPYLSGSSPTRAAAA
jgi:hypothetical protein